MVYLSLVFNRKNELSADGKALIQIRAQHQSKARYFSTGIRIEPRHWAQRLRRVVDCENAPVMNLELKRQIEGLEAFILKYSLEHKQISLDALDGYFKPQKAQSKSFIEFVKSEMKLADLAANTRRGRTYSVGLLEQFCPALTFEQLNYDLLTRYDAFLRSEKLHTNTIAKHHQILRLYINIAIKKSLLVGTNPYAQFRIKTQATTRTALTPAEIKRLEELEAVGTLAQVRDMFLLSCYTGLRFSDLAALTPAAIGRGADGLELRIRAQKTQKPLVLPLDLLHQGKPAEIVTYYMQTTKRSTLFDPITNQAANRVLKQLSVAIGCRKQLTMHIARHTFATNLVNKIPVAVLQQLLQHSDLKTTMQYVHLSNKMINNELKKVDW